MKPSSITVKSFGTKLASLGLIVGLLITSTLVSVSKNTLPNLVNEWYAALKSTDADKFETLMSADAQIELKFLGLTQTKSEFIDSLDEWKNANKGAVITIKHLQTIGSETTVETCYRFASNETLSRETFTIVAEKITHSVQEEISKSCPSI